MQMAAQQELKRLAYPKSRSNVCWQYDLMLSDLSILYNHHPFR